MKPRVAILGLSLGAVTLLTACEGPKTVAADAMLFNAPSRWRQEAPDHATRSLQFRLPSRFTGFEDARLIVWNLSAMGTRRDEASLRRIISTWSAQMVSDDGASVSDDAMETDLLVNNMPVHVVDISGRYAGPTARLAAHTTNARADRPGYRMIAACIRAPQADYMVKLVGPAPVVADHLTAFERFIASVQPIDGMTPTAVVGASRAPRARLTAGR